MEPRVNLVITELCGAVEALMKDSSELATRVAELRRRVDSGQETAQAIEQMVRLTDEAERHRRSLDTREAEELLLSLRDTLAEELRVLTRLAERRRRGLRVAPEEAAVPVKVVPARARMR